jgi:hypothetical protein
MLLIEHLLGAYYIKNYSTIKEVFNQDFYVFLDGALNNYHIGQELDSFYIKLFTQHDYENINLVSIQKNGYLNNYLKTMNLFIQQYLQEASPNLYTRFSKHQGILFYLEDFRNNDGVKIKKNSNNYGDEFLYITPQNKEIVFSIPKAISATKELQEISKILRNVTGLINTIQTEIYTNALLSSVLAHKYIAINYKMVNNAVRQDINDSINIENQNIKNNKYKI